MSLHLKLLDIDHPLTFEESKLRQIEAHNLIYLRVRKGVTDERLAPCKKIQDSLEFWIPRRGFRIPGTEFWIAYRWQTMANGIANSLSWITDTKPRIPDSANKNF